MLTADWILLLAMTASPAPFSPSIHPIASPTALAQVGGWRGNPPPPPPPVERVRPRRGFVWVEGGYDWRGRRYVRRPGHWERLRLGRQWHGGHWEWQVDHYGWVLGGWSEGPAYVAPPEMVVENPASPPPPPPQAAPPPPQGRTGFVWIAGAQEWHDGRYVWIEGHWEPERPGDAWRPGHWDREGDRQAWHPGGWAHGDRDHDHDHGDHDYDHGDHDHGDHDYDHDYDHGDHDHDHGDHDHDRDHGHGDWHGQEQGYEAHVGISIAGQIFDQTGRPAAGITVVLAGSSEGRAVTDGAGRYVFTGLAPGSYAVRPNDPRCGFRPDVMNLNNLGSNAVQDFSASCR
jgi:Carboxypeptidase regulatory-like domain/WXXGXW repeat (2 copies)